MSSSQKAKIALALALLLLCLSGLAAGFVIDRLYQAEAQVHHTYDVEVSIGDLESSLTSVGRSRVAYVDSATPQSLQQFYDAVTEVGVAIGKIRRLTTDALAGGPAVPTTRACGFICVPPAGCGNPDPRLQVSLN